MPMHLMLYLPCGKQHFRELPTPDFVRTLRPYPILNSMLDSNIYLQYPAWVFRGNVVSHMVYLSNSQDEDCDAEELVEITEEHAIIISQHDDTVA